MALIRRANNEIAHGEMLAMYETEVIWGWATPAGLLRAERRARLVAEGAGLQPGVRALEIGCGARGCSLKCGRGPVRRSLG